MLIMAKTKTLVPRSDEVASEESSEDLEALIKEARGEDEKETEDASTSMNDMEVSFDKQWSKISSMMVLQIAVKYDFDTDLFCTCFCHLLQEVVLTDEENAIKAYLSDGEPLSHQILDMVIRPYWKEEPYM